MNSSFSAPELSKLPRPDLIDDKDGASFTALLRKHKISSDEYAKILDILGRRPTLAELGIFSAMWSEHCSYKSSRVHLKRFPTEGPDVVVGPGENAGVVRLSGKLCLAFKMESHNHPSYIEPYQGAATGVGGILRDVFCMGARPIANLNALRFGLRTHKRTPHLVENVVKGIGDYGNCVGVPTVAGNISFDASYNGNCLVNAMTVGVIHEDRIFKGYASGRGNLVIYLGSATGRDGIHGASMASGSFATKDANERSTVQVGDPFTEKLLLEATLEVLEKGLVVGLQDMGAAGLTSSAFEMAGRAGNGLFMDLDHVPVRTAAMSAYELLLSESQERMLMVIEPHRWDELKAVLDKWQLACTVIGVVTDTGRVQIQHQGQLEVDVPVAPMTDAAPKYERPMKPRAKPEVDGSSYNKMVSDLVLQRGPEALLLATLRDTGDKEKVYRQYDHHIGTQTVLGPEEQGAAALWVRSEWADPSEPFLGMIAVAACNERYNRLDAYHGGAHAVLKAARSVAAAGGKPLAITDCLNYGNPEDPAVMADFSAGVDGISEACRELAVPVVSGNVSLYNETDGESIAPTPMIGMVGKISDVRLSPAATVKQPTQLFLLYPKSVKPEFGGSLAAKLLDQNGRQGVAPAIDWLAEKESMNFLREVINNDLVAACRDVGDGGIVTTAVKMIAKTDLGLTLRLQAKELAGFSEIERYLGELGGSYLLAIKPGAESKALQLAASLRYNAVVQAGQVEVSSVVSWGPWTTPLQLCQHAFTSSLV
ncbi:MAG: phosphoribosylformylglycinamidine synthase subunit PurL [Deltaproteobacteria bacterium]|nr:phosphoribosylformylglycinamidine synthase subunit PurL [Deltaproteobacteria bacterium]